MAQQTTQEFAQRLVQAVEAHPLAPGNAYGSQAWLREKLKREGGIEVSANAVHKWMNGTSKPREDNIRTIAKVLNVDEVWLSLGPIPGQRGSQIDRVSTPSNVRGHVLVLAGLIEMAGGRVLFGEEGDPANLKVNMNGQTFGIVALRPDANDGKLHMVIPEPVGDARVVAVNMAHEDGCSACLCIYDVTDLPRKKFGGYSLLEVALREDGKLKAEGAKALVDSVGSVGELALA